MVKPTPVAVFYGKVSFQFITSTASLLSKDTTVVNDITALNVQYSQYLQQPITSPTPLILVIPFKCIQNTEQVNRRSQNDKHVEYLMRAPPNIKLSWIELFWKSHAINKGAEENQSTLRIVIGETRLFVELLKRE